MENDRKTIYDAGTLAPRAASCENVDIDEEITVGTYFEIILKSNPHNGYMWYVSDERENDDGVSFVKQDMQPLPRYSGTRQHFIFYANNSGYYTIPFVYKRSWEVEPYATFTANIHIE